MPVSDDVVHPEHVDGLVVHAADHEWAMSELGPCLIVVWRGPVTEERLRLINERLWNLSQARPGACTYLNVIEPTSPAPNGPLRKMSMEGIARPGKALTCIAAVLEGNELRLAMVRAVMTGMALLRPRGQSTKFFKTTSDMAGWVVNQLRAAGAAIESDAIVRACEETRSAIGA